MKINRYDDYKNSFDSMFVNKIADLSLAPTDVAKIIYDYLGGLSGYLLDSWQASESENIPFYIQKFLSAVSASIKRIHENNTQPITLSLFQDEKDNVTEKYKSGTEALSHLFLGTGVRKVRYPTLYAGSFNSLHYFRLENLIDLLKQSDPQQQQFPLFLDNVIKPSLLLCGYTEYCLTPLQAKFLIKQINLELIQKKDRRSDWTPEEVKSLFAERQKLTLEDINEYFARAPEQPRIEWFADDKGGAKLVISPDNYYLKKILTNIPTFISDWVSLESRGKSQDFLKDVDELKFIPVDLIKTIYEYLDVMITDQEIKELVDVNKKLQALEIPRYTTFQTKPDVLHIYSELLYALESKRPAKVSYDEHHKDDHLNYTFYYDPTKGLAELINGVKVGFGTDQKLRDRFAESPKKMFSLLTFLKDFRIAKDVPSQGSVLVQQLLTGILKLAQTHQALELNSQECSRLVENTGKKVNVLTSQSSLKDICHFESSLNTYLKEQKCDAEAIDFVTVNIDNIVTIYVKSTDPEAAGLLYSASLLPKLIHISPSAYLKFMAEGGMYNSFLKMIDSLKKAIGAEALGSRQQYLQRSLNNLKLPCDSKSLSYFNYHNHFGYQASLSPRLFQEIKSLPFIPKIQAVQDHVLNIVNQLKIRYVDKPFKNNKKCAIFSALIEEYTKIAKQLVPLQLDKETELEQGKKFLTLWITALETCLQKNSLLFASGKDAKACINESLQYAKTAIKDFDDTLKMLKSGKLSLSI